jgi:hypothetical protein
MEIHDSGEIEGDVLDEDLLSNDGCDPIRQPCKNGLLEVECEEKKGEGHQDQKDQWNPGHESSRFHEIISLKL